MRQPRPKAEIKQISVGMLCLVGVDNFRTVTATRRKDSPTAHT